MNQKKKMHGDMHIGKLILQQLKEQERSVAWLARQVNVDGSNLGRLLKKSRHIHAELLWRISTALNVDFFVYYSELINQPKSM